jgi:hypothetical protein
MTTVYFHLPDVNHAAGGVRAVYRIVDACNAVGIPAAVLHQARGFRPTWFSSNTRVLAAQDTRLRADDVLVMSELDAARLIANSPGLTKVLLNQHQYWTFSGGAVDYQHPDIAAVIAVSEDGMRYLRCAFPGLEPYRLRCAVDGDLFRPGGEPTRTVGYLATKGAGPRTQVLAILKSRRTLNDWTWRPLSGLTQEQMAQALEECAVLATFSESEGFQMLLTEAMSCGTAVVGFDAGGGREYLTEAHGWPVPAADVVRFAERLEEVTFLWDTDRQRVVQKTAAAADFVRTTYTVAHEAADAVEAVRIGVDRAREQRGDQTYDVAEIPKAADAVRARVRAVGKALLRG